MGAILYQTNVLLIILSDTSFQLEERCIFYLTGYYLLEGFPHRNFPFSIFAASTNRLKTIRAGCGEGKFLHTLRREHRAREVMLRCRENVAMRAVQFVIKCGRRSNRFICRSSCAVINSLIADILLSAQLNSHRRLVYNFVCASKRVFHGMMRNVAPSKGTGCRFTRCTFSDSNAKPTLPVLPSKYFPYDSQRQSGNQNCLDQFFAERSRQSTSFRFPGASVRPINFRGLYLTRVVRDEWFL